MKKEKKVSKKMFKFIKEKELEKHGQLVSKKGKKQG
jgi:hypothetical protein